MYNTINDLREAAVSQKRLGKFKQSFELYLRALQFDARSFDALNTYYALGKLAYLMEKQNLALKSYLAAIHLELSRVENDILNNTLPKQVEIALNYSNGNPEELPAKSAAIIFHDPHKPRHIAHALIDFSKYFLNENVINQKLAAVYRSSISGDGSYDKVVAQSGLTSEYIVNRDESFYSNIGIEFIIKNGIKWDQILSSDVYSIYFMEEDLNKVYLEDESKISSHTSHGTNHNNEVGKYDYNESGNISIDGGYDQSGYNKEGYDEFGYDELGYQDDYELD